LEALLERYESEMGSVVGHPTRLRGNLLNLVERLLPQDIGRVKAHLHAAADNITD
jgi:hypothetical protein